MLKTNSEKSVAIIGGGVAGLSAACKLAQQGCRVSVFESGPQLGGRARGVVYENTQIDNGQHILLGAYTHTLAWLAQMGVDESLVLQRQSLALNSLNLKTNIAFSLRTPRYLPAPLHLLVGLLRARGLSTQSKWAAVKFMLFLQIKGFKLINNQTLNDLFIAKNQPAELIEKLWEPLCLAALNTPLKQASAQIFANVLRDSFTHAKTDSDLLLPKVDLTELFGTPARDFLQRHGAQIFCNESVRELNEQNGKWQLKTAKQTREFSHILLACAPHSLSNITTFPPLSFAAPNWQYQPITTVYLQFNQSVSLKIPMLGLTQSLTQWVFDYEILRGKIGLLAVVISAHEKLPTKEMLIEQILAELQLARPNLTGLKSQYLRWHKIITEKKATFSCNATLARPRASTKCKNIYLAGDYVASESALTDYPATIEGAVRSGLRCADLMIAN